MLSEKNPEAIFSITKSVKPILPTNWHQIKITHMREIVHAKIEQNTELTLRGGSFKFNSL
jgi:predicted NAD-dependent protein-ADP-ribosyltransferase YbiA (DUF1768 family)